MTDATVPELVDPQFWRMPLEDRMGRFAELREIGAFLPASFDNPMTGLTERFFVTTRYAEVVEISRRPEDFCSGRGAVSIPDMPAEALEFFGSFINMDDPRHARLRRIVSQEAMRRIHDTYVLRNALGEVTTLRAARLDAEARSRSGATWACGHGGLETESRPVALAACCGVAVENLWKLVPERVGIDPFGRLQGFGWQRQGHGRHRGDCQGGPRLDRARPASARSPPLLRNHGPIEPRFAGTGPLRTAMPRAASSPSRPPAGS